MYLLTIYIKRVLWGVAVRLSFTWDAWCLKVNAYRYLLNSISRWKFFFPSTLASMALSLSFPYLLLFYEIYCNIHHEFYAVFRQI